MSRGNILILLIVICIGLLLTACNKKEEIVYEVQSLAELNKALSQTEEEGKAAENTSIAEKIGLSDMEWKEEVTTKSGTASINARVILPDSTEMYSMVVKEHYANNEDKRRLISAFFDEGTVEADTRTAEAGNGIVGAGNGTAEAGDYSADSYLGKSNGIDYTLDFYTDSDTNTSVWIYKVEDSADLHAGAKDTVYNMTETAGSEKNLCKISESEVIEKAERMAYDMGLGQFKANYLLPLGFLMADDEGEQKVEHDGYSVVLTRSQGKTLTDGVYHFYVDEAGKLVENNGDNKSKPYERERLRIDMNDKGLVSISNYGWMEDAGAPHTVQLMAFSEILESFRSIINEESKASEVTYESLHLTYARIPDGEDENKYRYIPAWRLSEKAADIMEDTERENIWLSALDGSSLDPITLGDIDFNTELP